MESITMVQAGWRPGAGYRSAMYRRERRIVVGTEIILVTVMLEPEFHHSIVKEFEGRVNLTFCLYDLVEVLK